MRSVRARISHHDSAERFRGLGVDVFLGDGRFTGPGHRRGRRHRRCASRGPSSPPARARISPTVPGLAEAGFLTNETRLRADGAPAAPGRHRRRAHRLRAGAGLRAPGLRGDALPHRRPHPEPRGRRRRGDRPARVRGRGHPPRARRQARRASSGRAGGQGPALRRRRADAVRVVVDEILVGAGRVPNVEASASRRWASPTTGRRREGERPPADHQPADLRRGRHLHAREVHPRRRLRGPRRHPERALPRAQEALRPDHPVVHVHRPRDRPRRPLRARRGEARHSRSTRTSGRSPRWTAPSSTARRTAS